MPLPDERPRQSVANLIGRFEQQTKRTSLPNSGPSSGGLKALGSGTDNTGGSVKDEPKEKREWPPKQTSQPTISSVPSTQAVIVPERSITSPSLNTSKPTSTLIQESSDSISDSSGPASKPAPSFSTHKSTVGPAGKNASTKSPETSKKIAPKSPPPSAQPIRAQHSGQSVATPSARKTPVPKPPAATMKSPSRSKTPISSRAKSPMTSRPKTPSAGLYAPTAASLARSKNAASTSTPSPVRKAASASSSDRLSKPTASSLSKSRTSVSPPPLTTPSRTATKTPTPRPSTGHRTPQTRSSTAATGKNRLSKASIDPETVVSATTTVARETPSKVIQGEDKSPFPDEQTPSETVDLSQNTGVHEPVSDAVEAATSYETVSIAVTPQSVSASSLPRESDTDLELEILKSQHNTPDHKEIDVSQLSEVGEAALVASFSPAEEHESDTTLADSTWSQTEAAISRKVSFDQDEGQSVLHNTDEPHDEDDLEDIVNLLEAKPRATNIIPKPDEVFDIPDED